MSKTQDDKPFVISPDLDVLTFRMVHAFKSKHQSSDDLEGLSWGQWLESQNKKSYLREANRVDLIQRISYERFPWASSRSAARGVASWVSDQLKRSQSSIALEAEMERFEQGLEPSLEILKILRELWDQGLYQPWDENHLSWGDLNHLELNTDQIASCEHSKIYIDKTSWGVYKRFSSFLETSTVDGSFMPSPTPRVIWVTTNQKPRKWIQKLSHRGLLLVRDSQSKDDDLAKAWFRFLVSRGEHRSAGSLLRFYIEDSNALLELDQAYLKTGRTRGFAPLWNIFKTQDHDKNQAKNLWTLWLNQNRFNSALDLVSFFQNLSRLDPRFETQTVLQDFLEHILTQRELVASERLSWLRWEELYLEYLSKKTWFLIDSEDSFENKNNLIVLASDDLICPSGVDLHCFLIPKKAPQELQSGALEKILFYAQKDHTGDLWTPLDESSPLDDVQQEDRHEPQKINVVLGQERSSFIETPVRTLRITEFEDYLKCPYLYFARHQLKAQPPEILTQEAPGRLRGIWFHRFAELFTRSSNFEDAWNDSIKSIDWCGVVSTLERRKQILIDFRRMALSYLKYNENQTINFLKVDTEISVSYEWKGILFRGRVDRVAYTQDSFSVIDYKTGSAPYTGKDLLAGRGAQLLMYALALKSQGAGEWAASYYIEVSPYVTKNSGGIYRKKFQNHSFVVHPRNSGFIDSEEDEILEPAKQIWSERVDRLLDSDFRPNPYHEKLCQTCIYKKMCGYHVDSSSS